MHAQGGVATLFQPIKLTLTNPVLCSRTHKIAKGGCEGSDKSYSLQFAGMPKLPARHLCQVPVLIRLTLTNSCQNCQREHVISSTALNLQIVAVNSQACAPGVQ